MQLRDYQQASVEATLSHFRRSDDPAVIVLPTGAGKSLVIAELARLARFPILVLAHVKELVEQNHQKYAAYGLEAGIFAAGLGKKQHASKVTFASVQSLSRNLDKFDGFYSLVIIDECHRVGTDDDSQYQQVIGHLRKRNRDLKVLGLTATPYRLDSGWIYRRHYHGFVRGDEKAVFRDCIYELPLRYLVHKGYLTRPVMIDAPVARYQYDELPSVYTEAQLDSFLGRYPRVTEAICAQLQQLAGQRQGVMVFAASVKHAREISRYLPDEATAVITGETPVGERDALVARFKARELKYLVNVAVLTTGFDAPHVDVIAILRRTGSVSLYQQIVGRGLRLAEGKADCLVIDYAGNGFDLYQPEIGTAKPNPNSELVQVPCPSCEFPNMFWGMKDADGDIIEHYGRRCQGLVDEGRRQCDYRFRFKQCLHCQAENDIAARVCQACQRVLIDADNQLKEALRLKDRKVIRCAGISASAGDDRLRLVYHDEDGGELKETFMFATPGQRRRFFQIFRRTVTGQVFEPAQARLVAERIHERIAPDFVIARQDKRFWKIEHRIFDYQGPYRKANQIN